MGEHQSTESDGWTDPKRCPDSQTFDERPAFDLRRLSEYGVLWLINRVVFHPRGFALALEYGDGPEPIGWSIQGDGSEVWVFDGFSEDEKLREVEGLLDQARQFGRAPHIGPEPQQSDHAGGSVLEEGERYG